MSDPISSASALAASSASSAITSSASVATDTSRLNTKENLKAAGDKFEAIFTGLMIKSMRSTHLAEDAFGSKAQDTFRDMQDDQLAKSMAAHAPIGIGKAMTAFLAKSQPNLNQDDAKPTP